MSDKEALKLALELFEQFGRDSRLKYEHQAIYKTIVAIKEALSSPNGEAQPAVALEQEPVATLDDLEQEIYENTRQFVSRDVMEWMLKRYYTTPPQRTAAVGEDTCRAWVGLTEEEVEQLADGCCPRIYWQAIEVKLKEKNNA